MSEQDAEIARLRGALERARGVLEVAEFALNNCPFQGALQRQVEHGEALGQVRTALREIDAALKERRRGSSAMHRWEMPILYLALGVASFGVGYLIAEVQSARARWRSTCSCGWKGPWFPWRRPAWLSWWPHAFLGWLLGGKVHLPERTKE